LADRGRKTHKNPWKGENMETKTAVLEASGRVLADTDDINKILAEAAVKSTDEYRKGYEDGQNEAVAAIIKAVNKEADTFFGETVAAAEVFYSVLSDIIPAKDILQYRIGLDYTTKRPTALAVISCKDEDTLYDIDTVAARLDLFMFQHGRSCAFWVITDESLDQDLINRDFPWSKRS